MYARKEVAARQNSIQLVVPRFCPIVQHIVHQQLQPLGFTAGQGVRMLSCGFPSIDTSWRIL